MSTTERSFVVREQLNFVLVAGFIAIAFLAGGAARPDAATQVVVRLAALVLIAAAAVQMDRAAFRRGRPILIFLLACAGLVVIQLVPLPPAIWTALPGRSFVVDGFAAAGLDLSWHPITLTPDRTLNSLLALLPPMAAAMGMTLVEPRRYPSLLLLILAGIALSAVVGIIQISSGGPYLYRVTNEGWGVGLFANRNHQAALLACLIPLLACWGTLPQREPNARRLRAWLAVCAVLLLAPLLLATGSRGGLVLAAVGGAGSLFMIWQGRDRKMPLGRRVWLPLAVAGLLLLVAIAAASWSARDAAFQRFFMDEGPNIRMNNLGLYGRIAMDFAPFGSGFGSFDPVFRLYEPYEALAPQYLNHAHNEPLQIAIEGGALAVALALVSLLWFGRNMFRVAFSRRTDAGIKFGQAGAIAIVMILISSLVDYPLRTPILSVIAVISCMWLHSAVRSKDVSASKGRLAGPPA